jgi:hypothetical protein
MMTIQRQLIISDGTSTTQLDGCLDLKIHVPFIINKICYDKVPSRVECPSETRLCTLFQMERWFQMERCNPDRYFTSLTINYSRSWEIPEIHKKPTDLQHIGRYKKCFDERHTRQDTLVKLRNIVSTVTCRCMFRTWQGQDSIRTMYDEGYYSQ